MGRLHLWRADAATRYTYLKGLGSENFGSVAGFYRGSGQDSLWFGFLQVFFRDC